MTLRRRSYLAEGRELNAKNVMAVLKKSGIRAKVYGDGSDVRIEFSDEKEMEKARKRLGSGWGGHHDRKRGVWVWRYSPSDSFDYNTPYYAGHR